MRRTPRRRPREPPALKDRTPMEIYRRISAAVRRSKNTNNLIFVEIWSFAEWRHAFDVVLGLEESLGGDVFVETSPLTIGHFKEAWRVHIYESRGNLTTRQVAELDQFEWLDGEP